MKYENINEKDCIRTVSGNYVNLLNPDPDTITIEDIAHSLSQQCRFGGNLPFFYSVAQHSVHVSKLCRAGYELQALMHDASEAYLLDIPRPLKILLGEAYKKIENNMMRVIADKFGFDFPIHSSVKYCDEFALMYEWNTVMIGGDVSACISMESAKNKFLETFKNISKYTLQ